MKKVFGFITALVMVASISQAVSIGWSAAQVGTDKTGNSYLLFVSDMNSTLNTAEITSLLTTGTAAEAAAAATAAAWASGTVTSAGAASTLATASGKTITYSGSGTDSYTGVMVIFNADKSEYVMTDTKTITMSSNTGSKTFAFGNVSSLVNGEWSTVGNGSGGGEDPVPEPTTVALLALGLAAFGLKRKIA